MTPGQMTLVAAGQTDVGRRRSHNEDQFLVREDLGLFAVADGAGGHKAGEVAAKLACTSIANYVGATVRKAWERPDFDRFGLPNDARRLVAAIQKANKDVVEISRTHGKYQGMGTTVVAGLYSPRSHLLHIAHVGDSRAYRLRRGALEQLTQDHSLLQDVLETQPELDDQVIARFPRSVVTRALGMDQQLRVSVTSHRALPGDRYLMCSDGLCGYVEPTEIEATLRLEESPSAVNQLLIDLANAVGGRDNIGVVVCDFEADGEVKRPGPQTTIPDLDDDDSPELMILGIEDAALVVTGGKLQDDLMDQLGLLLKKRPK
ncbi:MAG: serine/threonine-protein phosphatase [Myxococcales bacterium]|nr:serine/threonine-protein phosphatase [Myxococcales bacterium]